MHVVRVRYFMETYKWTSEEEHTDNTETMNEYLDYHLPKCFKVMFQDGTYAEIKNRNSHQRFEVHASGDGDFRNHKVEFKFMG